jgi:hypothetical protein
LLRYKGCVAPALVNLPVIFPTSLQMFSADFLNKHFAGTPGSNDG